MTHHGDPILVRKLDVDGNETLRYTGRVLERGPQHVQLEAFFTRDDILFHDILLGKDDRFVETFYSDRWYNVFELYDRDDGRLKGWYCNIGHPAVIQDGTVSYRDLALDLLVYPDGRQLVLDEDEFEALELTKPVRKEALAALEALQREFGARVFGE
jgi:uncharacterized protein